MPCPRPRCAKRAGASALTAEEKRRGVISICGGLIAGIAVAAAGRARVVGVEPERSTAMHSALAAGEPVEVTPRFDRLLVEGARVVGANSADRGRGRGGEPLANFEPGSDVTAQVTVLAEGTLAHLTGAALQRFGLGGEDPQVWALGVKVVSKVARPLDRVLHHAMGWPLRAAARYREFGGSFVSRWEPSTSRSGWPSASTTATRSSPCTTCSTS